MIKQCEKFVSRLVRAVVFFECQRKRGYADQVRARRLKMPMRGRGPDSPDLAISGNDHKGS